MKKLFATAILFASYSSIAATSAQLTLKGVIQAIHEIDVQATQQAQALVLTDAQPGVSVATVTAKSNNKLGYKVSVSSINAGKLVRSGDTASFHPYTAKYGGVAFNLQTSAVKVSEAAKGGTEIKDVSIAYAKPAEFALPPGDYTDVLTFTISAN